MNIEIRIKFEKEIAAYWTSTQVAYTLLFSFSFLRGVGVEQHTGLLYGQ